MLSDNERNFLFRALRANKCILFVGAGFSLDSQNRLGHRIPSGTELAQELWKWFPYEGEYDSTPLNELYEAALRSGRPMSELQKFLEDRLLATSLGEWYKVASRVLWYRIYGTNADNVIEEAYRNHPSRTLVDPINAVTEDFRERDQFLTKIQYVKLNGSLPGRPEDLTFSIREYARRSAQFDRWYDHFVRDYTFHPMIFVGTQLREPLFWQAIAARQPRGRNPEERPASFLVLPSISPAQKEVLAAYNITHIAATGGDFFSWLQSMYDFPDRTTTLRVVAPESAALLEDATLSKNLRRALTELLAAFPPVPTPHPQPSRPRNYFLGVAPRWEDIATGFDAPRDVTKTLLEKVEEAWSRTGKTDVLGVLGPGGSGKSTVLMRAALTLRQGGRQVFYSEGSQRPDISAIRAALEEFDRRVVLVIDNAHLFGPLFRLLIEELNSLRHPPVIIFAARMNAFERQLKAIEREGATILEVETLSDGEIRSVISILGQYAQLGRLASMSDAQRVAEFKVRARKQILVAMREATQGPAFDEIVRSEYLEIEDREARALYLCAAVPTAELIDITREQWLACAEVAPADALAILNRNLRGMVFEHEDGRLAARHSVIAELIVDRMADRADVREAYVRLLNAIANDIYSGQGRATRTWRLFVRLIDHRRIYARFSEDIELARSIFLAVDKYFQRDGHFWLQFANLEIEYGESRQARPHLAYAESLMPDHRLVLTTRAHLALRESMDVERYEDALALRHEGADILRDQIKESGKTDEYPYHVYISRMLAWIAKWVTDPDQKRRELEALHTLAEEALRFHWYSQRIKEVAQQAQHRYLMTTVHPDRTRPAQSGS